MRFPLVGGVAYCTSQRKQYLVPATTWLANASGVYFAPNRAGATVSKTSFAYGVRAKSKGDQFADSMAFGMS